MADSQSVTIEQAPTHEKSSIWLIIYTDLVSTLMIFFLLCYCITWLSPEEKMLAEASMSEAFGDEKGAMAKAQASIEKGLDRQKKMEGDVKQKFSNVEVSEEEIKIVLPSPVLFDSGSADLKPEIEASLHEIAVLIKKVNTRVVVEGHSDNIPMKGGNYVSNWELSSARAFSVIRYLIDKEGVSPSQLSALGCGEFRPVAPNDTNENKMKNRRIEIKIIKAKSS